jgi:uncharacterized protein (DUF58 family)
MLVPRTRLLIWFALIVLPCATIAGTIPAAFAPSLLVLAVFAAVVVADLLRARGTLHGLAVELPELVRLQKDHEGTFEVRVKNASQHARSLRLGFAFPAEVGAREDDRLILLPGGAELARLEWTCTPTRRGAWFLEAAYLETASPAGLWAARAVQKLRAELRVYPNLTDERRRVAALCLKRAQLGWRSQRQTGQGREFEKLRDYIPGDSMDEIHWKASAKRGRPVTKVFQVERTQEVYVIVDASRLSGREVQLASQTTQGKPLITTTTTLERYVTAALLVGLSAEQQGDQFGLITFSDRVLSFVRAKSGQAHYDACRDRLYALQPQIVAPDFDELAAFIRLRLRKRALLIFLTALDDPMLAESFAKNLDLICRQHLVLVNMLQPPGARPIFSAPDVAGVDDIYSELGGHLQWRRLRELEKVLQRRGVRFHLLDPEKLAGQLMAQHADVKARQLV